MRISQALAILVIIATCVGCDEGSAGEYAIALDIESGDERRLTDGEDVYGLALSPDGTLLVAVGGDQEGMAVVVLDSGRGIEQHRLEVPYNGAMRPTAAWLTDTQLLVLRGKDHDVYGTNAVLASWDLTTGEARDIAEFNGGGCCENRLDVAPDGSAVAVSTARRAYLVTLPEGVPTSLVDDVDFASVVAWTADSIFVLEHPPGQGFPSNLRRFNADGSPAEVVDEGMNSTAVAASRDGSALALADDGALTVISLGTGNASKFFGGRDPDTGRPDAGEWVNAVGPAWSPDGSRIAIAMDQGIAIVELATGDYERFVRHGDLQAWSIAWSPDGETLYLTVRKAHRGD